MQLTSKDLQSKGFDQNTASGFIRGLEVLGLAKKIGIAAKEKPGKGKGMNVYEVADEAVSLLNFDPAEFQSEFALATPQVKPVKTTKGVNLDEIVEKVEARIIKRLMDAGQFDSLMEKVAELEEGVESTDQSAWDSLNEDIAQPIIDDDGSEEFFV